MKKKKGFTLIELIAVLVILAILTLIITPLVLNIIKKSKVSADKRSVDAYGRSVEIAIANYLLDNSKFPTSIENLTVEYRGEEVVCGTSQINEDGSIYLAECTVAGRSVTGYAYGKDKEDSKDKAYEIGDEVTYNGVEYNVIENSAPSKSTVAMLKEEPLSYEEVQIYSTGTKAQTSNQNGYGGMQYHSESSNYETSYIKTIIDAWKEVKASSASEARLITIEELVNLGYEWKKQCNNCGETWVKTDSVPEWVYSGNYFYWTMSPYKDEVNRVWGTGLGGGFYIIDVSGRDIVVRPVIELSKTEL